MPHNFASSDISFLECLQRKVCLLPHQQVCLHAHTCMEFRKDTFSFVSRPTQYCDVLETSLGTDSKKEDGTNSDSMKAAEPDDPVRV